MITQDLVKCLFDYHPDGYLIWRDTNRPKVIPGTRAGSHHNGGYESIKINYRSYLAHRVIFLWHHGHLPKILDHINRSKKDNRIENLRDAKKFNSANRRKSINQTSIYKGVTKTPKKNKKWIAQCKGKNLGYFFSEEEAALAYNVAAIEEFGEYAHLNKIPPRKPKN